ncbi:hypothetical protein BRADI_3g33026v3, partial [Brachypodium distachyon]
MAGGLSSGPIIGYMASVFGMRSRFSETISHLLLGCVFARQVWERLWTAWGHVEWAPNADATMREWWCSLPFPRRARRNFRTGIILVLWTMWNHRNDVAFNGVSPSLQLVVLCLQEEFGRWAHAGLFRGRVSIPASM